MPFWSRQRFKPAGSTLPVAPANRDLGRVVAKNLFLLLVLWGAGVGAIHLGGPQRHVGLAEGQRAPATLVAAVDFDCVNVAATELLRRQAAEAVVPVFSIQMGPLQAAWRTLDKLAERAISLRRDFNPAAGRSAGTNSPPVGDPGRELETGLAVAADLLGVEISGEALAKLFPPGKEMDVLSILKENLTGIWMQGLLSEADRESGFQGLARNGAIDLLLPADDHGAPGYRAVALAELPSVDGAVDAYVQAVQARLAELKVDATQKTLAELVRAAMRPNLGYDERATEARRAAARTGIEPAEMTVRAGTTLMEERVTVSAQMVEMVNAYNLRMSELETPGDRRMKRLGDSVLMLVVLVVCTGWLRGSQPGVHARSRAKWLLLLLGLLAVALGAAYRYVSATLDWIPPWLVPYAIPAALPAMLAALLIGPVAAMATGLWTGLATALIFDRSFELLLLGLGGSVLAVVTLRNVRRRAQIMRAGLAVGLIGALVSVALAATYQHLPATILAQVGAGLASGVAAAVLATLLLPLLEWLFKQTTAISLLELTDMGHPLLQRLALEAPGTYHHSLMVGAIGQAAANRIGADGLLVAVCAYYHDIGKLAKPEFFGENQRAGENPHDELAPSMSALVIQSHVKEGLTLAKRYKLPRPVCDAIRSHHGTSLTSYFFQVARRALKESGQAVDAGLEHSYRYDGPKPHTRELSILMLADSVEAASRSLEKPTPHRIAEMVETLLRDKLLDGQLDRCPLSLAELHEIQASFVFSLTNILHGRNPYLRENPPAQPAAGAGHPAGGAAPAGPDARGPGVSG